MDEQSQNAHDELTDQDQFRMSHHMYHLPPRKRRLYKRSAASSRKRGLPPTEYWQRQRISMRRGYYSTFCRIWQGVGSAPKGGGILPSPRPPCLPPWGRCPRRGRMRVGIVGCIRPRRAAEDSGPYGQGSSHSVGADVPIRPESPESPAPWLSLRESWHGVSRD